MLLGRAPLLPPLAAPPPSNVAHTTVHTAPTSPLPNPHSPFSSRTYVGTTFGMPRSAHRGNARASSFKSPMPVTHLQPPVRIVVSSNTGTRTVYTIHLTRYAQPLNPPAAAVSALAPAVPAAVAVPLGWHPPQQAGRAAARRERRRI